MTIEDVLARLNTTLVETASARSAKEVAVPKHSSLAPTEFRVWERQVKEVATLNRWLDDLTAQEVANLTVDDQTARTKRRKRGVLYLFAALEGDLAEATAHLSSGTYDDIEEALTALSGLVITPAGAQIAEEEFRAARQDAGESLLKFAAKVRTKFHAAYPGEECDKNRDAKRQFIVNLQSRGLSRELARRCPLESTTYTELVAQAQHIYAADLMVQGRGQGVQRDPPQVNAVAGWYSSAHGKKPGNPRNQGKTYHTDSEARRNQDGQLRDSKGREIQCFYCKGNHYKRDCPKLQAKGRPKKTTGVPARRTINEIHDAYEEEDEDTRELYQLEEEVFGSGN